MADKHCGVYEEDVIDLVLGKHSAERSEELARHLQHCSRCAALHREWAVILDSSGEVGAPAERLQPAQETKPSPRLKTRLLRSIDMNNRLPRRRAAALSSAAACVLLAAMAFVPLRGDEMERAEPSPVFISEPATSLFLTQNRIVNDPKTVLHQAVPVMRTNVRGYVWINDMSNELLILAEGLDPLEEKDYQVWFIIGDSRANAGVLQWKGRMAHLYVHDGDIRRVTNIAVSIEPKGGSFSPTGPEAMIVNIRP
ncbi:anti-sigma factor [Brevibacillus sp. NL20B1]|uniref:anti-sigma factor n=1 Tax=Brevibacillus sp. NL20B1 TaxID=2829799 RepID=UPI001BA3AE2D|nr:anti-sigma factor [Brevibacillus sp. NL20B1]